MLYSAPQNISHRTRHPVCSLGSAGAKSTFRNPVGCGPGFLRPGIQSGVSPPPFCLRYFFHNHQGFEGSKYVKESPGNWRYKSTIQQLKSINKNFALITSESRKKQGFRPDLGQRPGPTGQRGRPSSVPVVGPVDLTKSPWGKQL